MSIMPMGIVPSWDQTDRLRKARELTGLTQAQFAATVKLSTSTVKNYESGRSRPSALALEAWSRYTGVSMTWLETGTAPSPRGGDGAGTVSRLPESNRRPIHYKSARFAA